MRTLLLVTATALALVLAAPAALAGADERVSAEADDASQAAGSCAAARQQTTDEDDADFSVDHPDGTDDPPVAQAEIILPPTDDTNGIRVVVYLDGHACMPAL